MLAVPTVPVVHIGAELCQAFQLFHLYLSRDILGIPTIP
jgi:hypothetical protein